MLTGRHLIAGEWVAGEKTFASDPVHGPSRDYALGTPEVVDRALRAAEDAFLSFGWSSRADRAAFLGHIAREIDARVDAITEIANAETGLPEARLVAECGRTCAQLSLFAQHIEQGDYLDLRHDPALPERAPLPRPDLRLVQRPLGPVGVFGASNFPLAFSVAGGDTASALAAGCPVIVKGHPAHPGTSEYVAQAIHAAIQHCNVHPGVFSLVQSATDDVGTALVEHPLTQAIGFTGSIRGGRALFDLCARRAVPIPFFGELGSINPMFLLPRATAARGSALGAAWAESLTMGVGQFCTNPGVAVVIDMPDSDVFANAVTEALGTVSEHVMLTNGIADAYRSGIDRATKCNGVTELLPASGNARCASPGLYTVSGDEWLANESLQEEVFGPLGIIVRARDIAQMQAIAHGLAGQLTATLHMDEEDHTDAAALLPILERKAGRVLANGFPTGVEVCDAMVHGGPYPASTNFGATSVGTLAIRRFLRPVCYQNVPAALIEAAWIN